MCNCNATNAIYLETLQVVLPANATAVEKSAADELATYVWKITGRTMDIVTEGKQSGKAVYIGATKYAADLQVSYPDNDFGEGWAIKAVDGNLVLTGGKVRGALYAVYHLLEDVLGIHWWNLWEEYVPSSEHAAIPTDLDKSGVPAMSYRDIYIMGKQEYVPYMFFTRNRLNGFASNNPPALGGKEEYGLPYHVHTFNHYFRPFYSEKGNGKYEDWLAWMNAIGNPDKVDYYAEHPEWFAYNKEHDEHMAGGQLCLNNEELYKAFEKKFLATIQYCINKADAEGKAHPRYYDISPADVGGHCQCPKCAASIAEHGPSGNLYLFINKLAAAAKKAFPEENLIVETLAYWDYLEIPRDDTTTADNVVIRFADNYMDILHDIHHKNNNRMKERLKAWQKRTKKGALHLWDYSAIYPTNGVFPCMYKYQENMKVFLEHNVGGYFVELEEYINTDFWDMKVWLLARVMEDPYQDYDGLMNEFIRCYYGEEAGKYIREYLDFVHEKAEAYDGHTRYGTVIIGTQWLDAGDVLHGDILFRKAMEAAGDNEIYCRRLRTARCGLDRVIAEGYFKWTRQAEESGIAWDIDKKTVLNRLILSLEEQKANRGDDGYAEKQLAKYGEMLNILDNPPVLLPEELSGYEEKNIYAFSSVDMDLHGGEMVRDEDSPCGRAAKFDLVKMYQDDPSLFADSSMKRTWGIDGDNPLILGVYRERDDTNLNEYGYLYAKDLIVDGQYHLYKIEDVVVIDADRNMFAYMFRGWNLQIASLPQNIAHLKDQKVDLYISMKLTGDISCSDLATLPTFTVDRVFVVDKNTEK